MLETGSRRLFEDVYMACRCIVAGEVSSESIPALYEASCIGEWLGSSCYN